MWKTSLKIQLIFQYIVDILIISNDKNEKNDQKFYSKLDNPVKTTKNIF